MIVIVIVIGIVIGEDIKTETGSEKETETGEMETERGIGSAESVKKRDMLKNTAAISGQKTIRLGEGIEVGRKPTEIAGDLGCRRREEDTNSRGEDTQRKSGSKRRNTIHRIAESVTGEIVPMIVAKEGVETLTGIAIGIVTG